MIVEVEYRGEVKQIRVDPIRFFAEPDPAEIELFEQAVGTERFDHLMAEVTHLATNPKDRSRVEQFSAPDLIATIVNVRMRTFFPDRPLDAPVGYRNTDGEVSDMREVAHG